MDKHHESRQAQSKSETRAEVKTAPMGMGAIPNVPGRELIEVFQAEAARAFGMWEKAAGEIAEKASRDPRTLALGSAMLRSQLLTGKAMGLLWEAALAPLNAMVQTQEQP